MIALETNASILINSGGTLKVFDSIFLTLFLMEILMKWYSDFWGFWYVSKSKGGASSLIFSLSFDKQEKWLELFRCDHRGIGAACSR